MNSTRYNKEELEQDMLTSIIKFSDLLEKCKDRSLSIVTLHKLAGFSNRLINFLNAHKDESINSQQEINEAVSIERSPNYEQPSYFGTFKIQPMNSSQEVIEAITTQETSNSGMSLHKDTYNNTLHDYARIFANIQASDLESFYFLSTTIKNSVNVFHCTVCNIQFNEPQEIANHITQAEHKYQVKKKLSILKNDKTRNQVFVEENNYFLKNYTCQLCKIKFDTPVESNSHLESAQHTTFIINWIKLSYELCRRASSSILDVTISYLPLGLNSYQCVYCIESIPLRDVVSHLSKHKNVQNQPSSPKGFACLTCNFRGNVFEENSHKCKIKTRIICYYCKSIIISLHNKNISKHLLEHKKNKKEPQIPQEIVNSRVEDNSVVPPTILNYFKSPYCLQSYLEQMILRANRENDAIFERNERVILFIKVRLSTLFEGEMPEKITAFGSRMTGMYLPGSDLDISVSIDHLIKKYNLSGDFDLIASLICSVLDHAGLHEVTNCHVPVLNSPRVRFTHLSTKTDVDLSFKTGVGIYNSKLLIHFSKIQPILISLVRIIKIWSKEYNVFGYPNLTSHALILLIIFYMQTKPSPPLLPSVKEIKNKRGQPKLFLRNIDITSPCEEKLNSLIEKYGENNISSLHELTKNFLIFLVETNFEKQVISPFYGKAFPRTTFQTHSINSEINDYFIQEGKDSKTLIKNEVNGEPIPMVVQDTLDLTKNVTGHMTKDALTNLKKYAAKTAHIM